MYLVKEGILLADADVQLQFGREQSCHVIFWGLFGHLIYLACPAPLVRCDVLTLLYLLEDLDRLRYSSLEECSISLSPDMPEPSVCTPLSGGSVRGDIWMEDGLYAFGIKEAIEGVLCGEEYVLRVPDQYELEEKADTGSAEAQYFLGYLLNRQEQYDTAHQYFVAAAKQGLLASQNRLTSGRRTSREEQNYWLSIIAARSDSDPIIDSSKLRLARHLEDGDHIGRDYRKAALLYFDLCKTAYRVSASFALGKLYLRGSGVEKDYSAGLTWLLIGQASYACKSPPFFSVKPKEVWQAKCLVKLLKDNLDPSDVTKAENQCKQYMQSGQF